MDSNAVIRAVRAGEWRRAGDVRPRALAAAPETIGVSMDKESAIPDSGWMEPTERSAAGSEGQRPAKASRPRPRPWPCGEADRGRRPYSPGHRDPACPRSAARPRRGRCCRRLAATRGASGGSRIQCMSRRPSRRGARRAVRQYPRPARSRTSSCRDSTPRLPAGQLRLGNSAGRCGSSAGSQDLGRGAAASAAEPGRSRGPQTSRRT